MNALFAVLPRWARSALVLQHSRFDAASLDGFSARLATSPEHIREAHVLLHDSYVARGLMQPHPSRIRLTPHLLLPTTHLFVALHQGRVVGTIALTGDSDLGLPMEAVFPGPIHAFRTRGLRLAEVGALCIAAAHRGRGVAYLLNKIMWHTAFAVLGIDGLVITVHQRARWIYETLNFSVLGSTEAYPGLLTASSLGMYQDVGGTAKLARRLPPARQKGVCCLQSVVGTSLEDNLRLPDDEDLALALGARATVAPHLVRARQDVIRQLSPATRHALRREVPSLRPVMASSPSYASLA